MVNSVTVSGRLTRDPELRRTNTGRAVTSFTIAFNNRTKDEQGNYTSSFINCTAWGTTAEYLANYAKKGNLLCIEGRLQERRYTRNDGSNASVVEIIVNNVEFMSGSKSNSAKEADLAFEESAPESDDDALGTDIADDDLPF